MLQWRSGPVFECFQEPVFVFLHVDNTNNTICFKKKITSTIATTTTKNMKKDQSPERVHPNATKCNHTKHHGHLLVLNLFIFAMAIFAFMVVVSDNGPP